MCIPVRFCRTSMVGIPHFKPLLNLTQIQRLVCVQPILFVFLGEVIQHLAHRFLLITKLDLCVGVKINVSRLLNQRIDLLRPAQSVQKEASP